MNPTSQICSACDNVRPVATTLYQERRRRQVYICNECLYKALTGKRVSLLYGLRMFLRGVALSMILGIMLTALQSAEMKGIFIRALIAIVALAISVVEGH